MNNIEIDYAINTIICKLSSLYKNEDYNDLYVSTHLSFYYNYINNIIKEMINHKSAIFTVFKHDFIPEENSEIYEINKKIIGSNILEESCLNSSIMKSITRYIKENFHIDYIVEVLNYKGKTDVDVLIIGITNTTNDVSTYNVKINYEDITYKNSAGEFLLSTDGLLTIYNMFENCIKKYQSEDFYSKRFLSKCNQEINLKEALIKMISDENLSIDNLKKVNFMDLFTQIDYQKASLSKISTGKYNVIGTNDKPNGVFRTATTFNVEASEENPCWTVDAFGRIYKQTDNILISGSIIAFRENFKINDLTKITLLNYMSKLFDITHCVTIERLKNLEVYTLNM